MSTTTSPKCSVCNSDIDLTLDPAAVQLDDTFICVNCRVEEDEVEGVEEEEEEEEPC